MNRKLTLLIFSLALLLAAGLVPVYHLQKADQTLADQIASMEKELAKLRQAPAPTSFEAEAKSLVMNYREIENKYIIIKEDAELLLLPVNSSPRELRGYRQNVADNPGIGSYWPYPGCAAGFCQTGRSWGKHDMGSGQRYHLSRLDPLTP